MKRFARLAVLAGLTPFLTVASQTNFVRIGDHDAHPSRILVKRKADTAEPAHAQLLNQHGLKVRRQFSLVPGLVALEEKLPDQAATPEQRAAALFRRIEALRKSGQYEYVEPDYVVRPTLQPTDARFLDGTLWGLKNSGGNGGVAGADIDAERAWDITTGSTNVIVAIIDTGIRYTHQELATQMWRNPGESGDGKETNGKDDDGNGFVDDVYGINAVTGTGDPMDIHDHGTHVAGTIGAQANGGGPRPHVGVAWSVRLMGLKFLDPSGMTSDAIECLNYAVKHGAKISNNSWGGGGFSQSLYDALVAARKAGHLFVAAAGNEGTDNDVDPHYPSSYDLDNVIAVAALDRRDRLAAFSCYGLTSVDLGAPGVSIYSSTSGSDTEYQVFQGTSMAAPHVTGVAALFLAKNPEATYAEIRDVLLATTVPVKALDGKCVTGGRVNAYNALTASPDGELDVFVTPPSGDSVLSPSTQDIFVRVTDLFRITNATVTATVTNNGRFYTNLTFLNNGTAPDVAAADGVYSTTLIIPPGSTNLSLTVTATAPNKIPGYAVVAYSMITLPTNDNFGSPKKIPAAGSFSITTTKFATMEPGEPLHAGVATVDHSLWWTWSPATAGQAILDPTGSSFDTVLAVYTGTNLLTLTPVASVDDVGKLKQGYLFFNAVAGTTYRIAAAGKKFGEVGTLRLRAEVGGLPDTNAPFVAVTSPASGSIHTTNYILLAGTSFDPSPNASGVSEISILLNNNIFGTIALGTTNWTTPLLLRQGFNTVQIMARDYAANRSPTNVWYLVYEPQLPPNDHFNYAAPITNTTGKVTADTSTATKEYGEPNHAGNDGGRSVWWTFTPPANGLLSLSTTNSDFDTLLGLYTGAFVDGLTTIAANDDQFPDSWYSRIDQAVLGGQTYYVAVDGYAGASGTAELAYRFTPQPVFALTVSSTPGGVVSPGSGYYVSNAPVVLTATPEVLSRFAGWSGSFASAVNPLAFALTNPVAVTAHFTPKIFTDDFEKGNFDTEAVNWNTNGASGNVPWFVQSDIVSSGQYAARSGSIGNNQVSSLFLTVVSAGGSGAFDVRVSSELNFDFLEFYVGTQRLDRWSGNADWLTYQFAFPAGACTLEWRYKKDFASADGLDAAFIDNLDLQFVRPVFVLTDVRRGAFNVQITNPSGQEFHVQASPDLVTWTNQATFHATNSVIPFSDPSAATSARLYYRAVMPLP